MNKLPQNLIEELKKPLAPEAIAQHPTKSYLSTIKAIYVVERFNEVFGLGGWFIKNEFIEKVKAMRIDKKTGKPYEVEMVVIKSILQVPEYGIEVEMYGGNDNDDLGDAYKGACTDALTKIGSYLYVGMDVYKGLSDKPMAKEPKVGDVIQISDTKKIEIPACDICGGAMEQKKWGNATFWGCKELWKEHKEKGEKPKPIFQKDLEQELPIIENDQPF